jgi:diacylglycerol kinase family enzyme
VLELTDVGQLVDEASAALAAGCLRAVVSAGGDGTANLLAEHLPPGTPLAILPLGTENLLAKHLRQTNDPALVADRLMHGATVRLDAGSANGHLFVLIAGCGFDAEVVRKVHNARKGHVNYMSYAKPILSTIRSYDYPELRLYCDPSENPQAPPCITAPLWAGCWIFVTNFPRYAIGLSLVPEADGADGMLDLCTFRAGGFWNGIRYLIGVALQQHLSWTDVRTWRLRTLRIEADVEVPFQIDGDPGGNLPVTIETLAERLTLVVDEGWAHSQGFVNERTISSADHST